MGGRRPVSQHPRITSRPRQLAGGGTQSGSLDIEAQPTLVPRGIVQARRAETTNQTVGDALTARMLAASDKQMPDFLSVLEAVRREADSGDMRAADAYGYALRNLAQADPGKWLDFYEGSGLTQEEWGRYFNRDDSTAAASTAGPEVTVIPDEDPVQAEMMAEQMPSSTAGSVIDLESLLAGFGPPRPASAGGELAAQLSPAIPGAGATRADFPTRIAQLINSQNDLEGRPRTDAAGNIMPASDIAKQFYYDDRPPSSTREMFPELESVANIRMLAQLSGQPFQPVLPNVVGRRSEMPMVANDFVRPAMDLISQHTTFSPETQSLSFREGVDPAELQAQIRSMIGYAEPEQVQSLLAGLRGEHPTLSQYELEQAARGTLGGYTGPTGIIPAGAYGGRGFERDILNTGRSVQQKMGEHIDSVLSGRTRDLNLDLLTAGPARSPYWRDDRFIAPDTTDLGLYRGRLPPEIVATFIAQQMGRNEPSYIANLVPYVADAMQRQADTPAPAPARGYQFQPPHFEMTPEWLNMVNKFYEKRGVPRPPIQDRGAMPAAQPSTPNLNTSSMMPNTPRFEQYRSNPLTSLIG